MQNSLDRTIRQAKKGVIPLDEAVFFVLGAITVDNVDSVINELYPELRAAVIGMSTPEAKDRWPIISTDDIHLRDAATIVWESQLRSDNSRDS